MSKDDEVFRHCYEKYRNIMIFLTGKEKLSLHRFFALIFFFLKAMKANLGSDEAIRR
jgi:hypothetical protein